MNPLSPLAYYRRHKRSALLQITLISVATVGLFILIAVLDTVPLRATVSYLTKMSRVIPAGSSLDPAVVSQVETHPDVARTISDNGLVISLPTLLGTDSQRLMGVSPEEAQVLMEHCGVRIREGRMFKPRSNEFVLSEEVARALDLELGDEIAREIGDGRQSVFDYYASIPAPLVLVGILEGAPEAHPGPTVRLGFVSAEYLNSHEMYAPRASGLLVVAEQGRKVAVDDFLETTIRSKYTEVVTFADLVELFRTARVAVYVIFGVVNSVVGVAMAFVVGIINRIAIAKRLSEFGLLHALGRRRRQLVRRLTLETAAVAGAGCLIGLCLAIVIAAWLKNSLFYDLGMELNLSNPAPFCFVLPIPLITVALAFLSTRRVFGQLDAVAIIEQDKLSQEPSGKWAVQRPSPRPLSSLTFYLRHRRRGVLMVLGTALMVLGVTLPVFLLSVLTSAMLPYLDYLQQVSVISPIHAELAPEIAGQVRAHPAVEHAIPVIPIGVQMILPPASGTDVRVFGVSETDLPLLLEVFGVQVQEGGLPRPRTNEVLLSAAIAANRDLRVGDVIGGKDDEDSPLVVDSLPTEMVVAGILFPDRPWVGFASYEYLRSHALTASRSPCLLVIPREGQKEALDTWLEKSVNSTQTRITTFATEEREYRDMTNSLVLTFALLECMIAAVAAVALTMLNHVFFTQRTDEFGILNALGRSRSWLAWRTVKETASTVGLAWVGGAGLCGIGLLAMQSLVYGPRGLALDFFSLTPWLLTTPLPLAVVAAGVGTISWALSRLDPVAVIERR